MSKEIGQNNAPRNPTSVDAADDLQRRLPSACSVPGYWDTLAANTADWAPVISVSPLWREANASLEKWKREYRRQCGGLLYRNRDLPQFVGKSSARIKEKTFEKLERSVDVDAQIKALFDQEPPIPRLEDLVRVRLETQFLDGVPFIANKLLQLASGFDPQASIERKGKLSGYFAQHVAFRLPVYFTINKTTTSYQVTCEVQVATSLATLVWENSHGLYESSRVKPETAEEWQWSPNDPRFLSRQLGHMIHLADGLFCQLRDQSPNRK